MNKTTAHRFSRRQMVLGSALAMGTASVALPSWAQNDWPTKKVTIFVPSSAGGAADFTARTFAEYVSRTTAGASVIVENHPGAGGIVGTLAAKNAAADGYNFLLSTNSTHAANLSLYKNLNYDPQKDFDPVGLLGKFGTVLMVRSDTSIKTLGDLIDAAKKSPGKLSFGYYSSSSRVPPELLKSRAKIDVIGASYKNITQIITDLLGGQIDFAFLDMLSANPALQNQRLRPIAVSAATREILLPQVPTVAETYPGYEVQGWIGFHAPEGAPKHAIERLSELLMQAVKDPTVKASLENRGLMTAAMKPSEMREFIAKDIDRWKQWIQLAGIKPQ